VNQCGGLQEKAEAMPADIHPICGSAPKTVLLVEDEDFVRGVTCELLEYEGYRVLKACNAEEARTIFRRKRSEIALLLTDVVLPDRNGCDLAQGLRALAPQLLVIFISGYFDNPYTLRPVQESGTFYLPKPFSAEALIGKVSRVLLGTDKQDAPAHAYETLRTA